ncbi:cryptochrome/photolyase family protein [Pseudoalteromonas sp. SSM20]|uniref:cryptochrome/photolyase family protein n=1 Tax=Pseudoalteromonas sp. SSM20 TaxID=3139394 RepID=UPI003BAD8E2D
MSTLYWIRRDFRLDDNPALFYALQQNCKHAVFITAYDTWRTHNHSGIQIDFIERHLNWFSDELTKLGIKVTVIECNTFDEQREKLTQFCRSIGASSVLANSEPELREKVRDTKLAQTINLTLYDADTILPYGSVLNKQSEMFKVFTPYKKAWLNVLKQQGFEQTYLAAIPPSNNEVTQQSQFAFNYEKQDSSKWPLAHEFMQHVLPRFLTDKVTDYANDRDFPAIKGTSGISPYLTIGAISPKRVIYDLISYYPHILEDMKAPIFTWLNELIWREFYRNLLLSFPNLNKLHDFQTKFKRFDWPDHHEKFNAWCNAQTGFPIVDAAMRQLKQTGWMHNRLRMIVASFLTKHLLVDWRLGEAFFMQHLIDGDLAANSGGWQWAAGTGCDAQPYFRIFNPITQSEKFDPDGSFIRKYLPELANVPLKYIHQPQTYLDSIGDKSYWPQLVDLKEARLQALDYYQKELNTDE